MSLETTVRERRRVLLGAPVDDLSLSETVELALNAIVQRRRLQHVALNTAKLVHMRGDDVLMKDVAESDIVGADGMGILWGARLLGIEIRERVPGIDLMYAMLALCEREGFRPFILGAKPEVLEAACEKITVRFPRLRLAGCSDGYFSREEEPAVVAQIQSAAPDVLFVAMPTPRKEDFLHRYRDTLGVPFLMGVGGSVDVLAGLVKRARWVQRAGFEWLYRTIQEPGRMWRRYLTTNSAYAWLLAKALINKQTARPA